VTVAGCRRRFPAREASAAPPGRSVVAVSSTGARSGQLGELLRQWRAARGKSQLDLAGDAGTTPRYVSFVETGRARPSRQMVVRLARALDVPLRERNHLLLAAGFAPLYSLEPLASPVMARVDEALASMLAQHEPFPAVVMDRGWNLLRANDGAARLFGRLFAPEPMPAGANVLRLVIEPGRVRSHIGNWPDVVPSLLERARREAVGGVLDPASAELVAALRARPDVADLLAAPDATVASVPVVDMHFDVDGETFAFFSVVSTIGTPIDVTAQELRVEAFFPADETTRTRWMAQSTPGQATADGPASPADRRGT
jgi:transcriptional regulator with XRE-family HTH domain